MVLRGIGWNRRLGGYRRKYSYSLRFPAVDEAPGAHLFLGILWGRGRIDIQRLRHGEQTLHCPSGYTRERMDQTLRLLASGALESASLITHRFPAGEAKVAWDLIMNRREEFLGIVLEWD